MNNQNENLSKELNSLLETFKPYKSIIEVKLNKSETLLCFIFASNERELENDGKVIDKDTYNEVRTILQNETGEINENNAALISAKDQIIADLINKNELEDQKGFLKEFEQFISSLPKMSSDFRDCHNKLMEINFDDWDIDESTDDDPRLIELKEIRTKMLSSFEAYNGLGKDYIKKKKLLPEDSEIKDQAEEIEDLLLPFEKKYPKQSVKIKRIFEILNGLERCDDLNVQITKVLQILQLSSKSIKKLLDYFNVNNAKKAQKAIKNNEESYWYTNEDIINFGKSLERFGVDLRTQFLNIVAQDDVETLPSIEILKNNFPKYICCNIGGKLNENNGKNHVVAMFLVKREGKVTILYKDSKRNWNNSSTAIEALLKDHYKNKVEFLRHSSAEQEEDSSCGPMAINNLQIMASIVKEANDQAKDGIEELIRLFNKPGGIKFTAQEQVPTLRISHVEHRRFPHKSGAKQDPDIDDLDTVLAKLELDDNTAIVQDNDAERKNELKTFIHLVNEYYDEIKNWGVAEIKGWSNTNKGQLSKNFDYDEESKHKICEAIAIMDRTFELSTGGYRLRDTQKVAILVFVRTNTKGHVSQINTGEGKTTIISIVAALKIMQGYKAHVITSNNVLAAEGVKDKKLFYNILDISVADNNPDDQYTDGPKACYSRDIVYGSMTSFQFDWLRDSFEKLNTMRGLDFNNIWVMLDEIDSLLIDQGSNIAKLSGPFPGMESLRYVYINVWVALTKTEEMVTQQIIEKLKQKAEDFSKNKILSEVEKQQNYEEYEDSLRASFLEEVKKCIKEQKDDLINKKIVAKHLHQYAQDSLERLIENAFAAKYQYNENVEYKIVKDKDNEDIIIPVDNQNTGVSMKNTILSNGLHQFLQIKHNLCLTYESLTSCYVSNLDYIRKYGSKLTGVTGTLGSRPERNLLRSVFNLEFSIIPPFKPKKLKKFPGKICLDEDFNNKIAIATIAELIRKQGEIKTPRAVLIVCASILDVALIAEEIENEAKGSGLSIRIRKYIDETDVHVTEDKLNVNDIVIATNLGGRGTDFKTSSTLEANGGLHVIKAFLPCNRRVEDQGLGRTARQGNEGTGQIIVRKSEIEKLGIVVDNVDAINFNEVLKRRDELESLRVKDIADNKVTELEFKGQLFNKFSLQYGTLKENHKSGIGNDVIKWIYVLRDFKEKWAFWLEKQAYTSKSIKEIIKTQQSYFFEKSNEELIIKAVDQEYSKFLNEAKTIISGTINHNPYYSICLAERYLESSTDRSDREKAKVELEHALKISESSEILYSAYIKLFEISIEDGNQILIRYARAVAKIFLFFYEKTCPDYKRRAKENLQRAEKALSVEYEYLQELIEGKNTENKQEESVLASILISQQQDPTNKKQTNLLIKHLKARFVCLGAYKGNVESLIKQLDGTEESINPQDTIGPSDGVIIATKVPKYLSNLNDENKLKELISERAVNELEYVGMSSIYQVRKIHDVHEEVITGAQIQIGSGFALLASAAAFPFLLPVNGPLAGAMISEGITDIITALIQQGEKGFNKKDYIIGKVVSYGITLLTMGISAIMSSTKILKTALNACRSLATKLRSVKGPFAGVCKFLANRLDKLASYLEKLIEKLEFARKTTIEQAKYLSELKDANKLKEFQQLQKSLKMPDLIVTQHNTITKVTKNSFFHTSKVRDILISVAMERSVNAGLNNLMKDLKPKIEGKVNTAVSIKIKDEFNRGTFNHVTELDLQEAISISFNTSFREDIYHVSKEIGLGIMRHSSNWKMQLAALVVDSILSGIDVATYTNAICDKFAANVKRLPSKNTHEHSIELIKSIINQISEQLSDMIYDKIVAITGKTVLTLPEVIYRRYKAHQENKADKKAISDMEQKINQIDAADSAATNTKCAHDAVAETLGLDKSKGTKQLADATNLVPSTDGASIEDIKQLFSRNGIDVVSGSAENAQALFKQQGSDRGVVLLSGNQGTGHAVATTMESGRLMVKDNGEKMSLDQYKQKHNYTKADVVVPENFNSSTMQENKHRFNRNRIAKATHPLESVGQGDGEKFQGSSAGRTKANIAKQKEENEKRNQQIRIDQQKAQEPPPPHSMKGSEVLRRSQGTESEFGAKGHARIHTDVLLKESTSKSTHTAYALGAKQQNILMDKSADVKGFLDTVKVVNEKKQSLICFVAMEDIRGVSNEYKQAKTSDKGSRQNIKYVATDIHPAIPGSGLPYFINTNYPVTDMRNLGFNLSDLPPVNKSFTAWIPPKNSGKSPEIINWVNLNTWSPKI